MKGPNNTKKFLHKAPLYCPAHLLPIPIKYFMKNLIDLFARLVVLHRDSYQN